MKRYGLLLGCGMALAIMASHAEAQNVVKICVQGTNSANPGNSCVPVDATNPLPVTASGSGSTVSLSQATPGSTNGVNIAPSAAAGVAITPVVGQGVSTLLGKASAGNLYDVYLTATADSWLMVFNSASAPTNGSTTAGTAAGNLVECVKVASGTTGSIQYPDIPERYSTGIYAAISSTACATLTLATTGLLHMRVQ